MTTYDKPPIQAIFIDRDGTIGGTDEIRYPGELELYHGVEESIRKLSGQGIRLFGFTNQPGISKGKSTIETFQQEMRLLALSTLMSVLTLPRLNVNAVNHDHRC